jgi:TPR repeat protein
LSEHDPETWTPVFEEIMLHHQEQFGAIAAGGRRMRTAMRLIRAAAAIWFCATLSASGAGLFEGPEHHRLDRLVAARALPRAPRALSAHAEAYLGYKYEHGLGVPQSYEMALTYYTSSAERGDPTGQYLLGLAYDKGLGVQQDGVIAYMWLNLAAAHAPRQFREYFLRLRDAEASKMTPAQITAGQRLAIEWAPRAPIR